MNILFLSNKIHGFDLIKKIIILFKKLKLLEKDLLKLM